MLMKLLGVCCAIAATGTVLVYGLGLQVQRPIAPLQAKQEAPSTTPKVAAVAASAPVSAPIDLPIDTPAETATQREDIDQIPVPVGAEKQASQTAMVVPEAAVVASEIAIAEPATVTEEAPVPEAEQVFVFWQPFRSRGSAQGFAQGLSARAEVPISVISEDTDAGRHYRVVLPYDSEAQRLERLAKLESATRLEMGE